MLIDLVKKSLEKISELLSGSRGKGSDNAGRSERDETDGGDVPADALAVNFSRHPQLLIEQRSVRFPAGYYYTVSGYRKDADLRAVVIPNGVTALERDCFRKCVKLEEVYIPDSVNFMDGNVFEGCKLLKSVRLSQHLTEIPFWGFRDCVSLREIEIPRKVSRIGFCAFWGSGLESAVLPEGTELLQLSAFALCKSLTSVSLPSGLREIEDSAFESTKALDMIELPEGLRSLGERAFWHSGIMSVNIPPRLTELKNRTFRDCTRLREIFIPDTVKTLGPEVFMGCTALESVRIPRGVDVDSTVFEGCTALRSLTIGDTAIDISRAVVLSGNSFIGFIVRMVNSGRFCWEESYAKEFSGLFLADMAQQLELYGFEGAAGYISRNINESLSFMAELDRPEAFDRLVSRGARLTSAQTDEYIRQAIEYERRELYISLIRYKRDILGFEENEGASERFRL